MIKSPLYKITCKACAWSKTFVPTSDVTLPHERPETCPQCNADGLQSIPLTGVAKLTHAIFY
jgi:hypothetical protein